MRKCIPSVEVQGVVERLKKLKDSEAKNLAIVLLEQSINYMIPVRVKEKKSEEVAS